MPDLFVPRAHEKYGTKEARQRGEREDGERGLGDRRGEHSARKAQVVRVPPRASGSRWNSL